MQDSFKTVSRIARAELKVRGSRFLAEVIPVSEREAAEVLLEEVRRRYHDATHHCYAYRLGPASPVTRQSDDGEPSGTAGRPILGVLEGRDLTNVLLVVTRYYGGTKLGVGGLTHAYADAAKAGCDAAEVIECLIVRRFRIDFPHELTGAVMHILDRLGGQIIASSYDTDAHLDVEVRASRAPELSGLVRSSTRGVGQVSDLVTDPPRV